MKSFLEITVKAMRMPFITKSWVALAYVNGKYNPPAVNGSEFVATDYLGLFISKDDPGFSIFTFNENAEYRAFHRCGESDASVEFALIEGWLHYRIPFEQWRLFSMGDAERRAIAALDIEVVYQSAVKDLSAVLYQARRLLSPATLKLEPMFLLAPRSNDEVSNDLLTHRSMLVALLGEDKAIRYLENQEKLRAKRMELNKG